MRFGYLLWAVAGALALYLLQRDPPAPDYQTVVVHREAIERLEPDTVVRMLERVRYVTPAPVQIATAPRAAVELVTSFCAPVHAPDSLRSSSGTRMLLLRSGSVDRGWFFQKDQLRLTGPTNDGDLVQGTWRVRGSSSFRVVGDSVLVRYDRWALPKQVGEAAAWTALGYIVGRHR